MFRWYYRGRAVFGAGLLFALLVMITLVGVSVWQAPLSASGPVEFLGAGLVVRHPQSPSLSAVLDGASFPPLPLAEAGPCLALLRTEPAVHAVVPVTAASLLLKSDMPDPAPLGLVTAVGVFPGTEDYLKSLITLSGGASPAAFGRDLFLPEAWAVRVASITHPSPTRKAVFLLDSPRATDPLNLTPVILQGGFRLNGDETAAPYPRLCFAGADAVRRASRPSFLAALPSAGETDQPLIFRPERPFIKKTGPGKPADYASLFSLSANAAVDDRTPPPSYLLVALDAAGRARTAALLEELRDRFTRQRFTALIEPVFPSTHRVPAGPLVWAAAGALTFFFLLIVLLANRTWRPVADRLSAGDSPAPRWRPSFLSRGIIISLIFGASGALGGLAFIPLYNLLAPADMKRTLSEALVLPLTRLVVPPAGLLVIAILMALFALLTLPGPVARARRIARRIEKEKKETETA